ncbi:ABC transporter permease [Mangrovibacillus cuniculi]|uniref:ABC transporter permease n=1 Tax=Mangrovibacillus cuniculi TaxID=2593652 RepID=A0A7S8HEK5_9BACI|nr:ABC transporter permease [Mangrovibacillus cuniculi]QPC45591.1 ABC transporter permease [Mangrovibacillus cuniculi]
MIIWNELKKIFTFKTIILLSLVTFVFYHLFILFDIDYFPNGRPATDEFKVVKQMIDEYGEYMDEAEFSHFKDIYNRQKQEAEMYIGAQKELVDAGVDTYEKFKAYDISNQTVNNVRDRIFHEEGVDVFWELQAREGIIERYEHPEYVGDAILMEEQQNRIDELRQTKQYTSTMSWIVFENYNNLIGNVALLIFLSIMIVVTPLYLQDRKNKVMLLQYTSKLGRRLFSHKFVAALIATTAVLLLQMLLFFSLYKGNGTFMFLPLQINSIFNYIISWYDLTFLHYIILTIIGIYVIGISILLMVAYISSMTPNYMTNIGSQIPLMFLLIIFGVDYFVRNITSLYLPQLLWPILLICFIGVAATLFIVKVKRERVRDVL